MCLTCGHTKGLHAHGWHNRIGECGHRGCYCPRYIRRRWWHF